MNFVSYSCFQGAETCYYCHKPYYPMIWRPTWHLCQPHLTFQYQNVMCCLREFHYRCMQHGVLLYYEAVIGLRLLLVAVLCPLLTLMYCHLWGPALGFGQKSTRLHFCLSRQGLLLPRLQCESSRCSLRFRSLELTIYIRSHRQPPICVTCRGLAAENFSSIY